MNVDTIGTYYIVHKIWCFIVKQLIQDLYNAQAVKSKAKNLTLPNLSLIVTN